MEEALIIAGIVIVAGGGGGAGLVALVRARRRSGSPGPTGTTTAEPPAASTTTTAPPAARPATGAVTPPDLGVPDLGVPDLGVPDLGVPDRVAAEPAAPPARPLDQPPPSAGRLARLRGRLARSQSALGSVLLSLLSGANLDDQAWEEIEDTLITADMGVAPAQQLVAQLRTEVKVAGTRDPVEVKALLRADLLAQLGPDLDRTLHTQRHRNRPAVVLVVGVNGTGKTTACGRLARALIGDGQTVLLGAADTFRAAAADQLQTWGERVGAETVRSDREGADPASVAFTAVNEGIDRGIDTVIVDTAGRLHTKTGLMDELGKIKRVIEKQAPVDEVLLVLDATTGQNGLRQARVFAEVTDITGIILTKLDGTAKGGIVIAVQREIGVPVKLVGLGEGPDDLAPFDPEVFVDAILGD